MLGGERIHAGVARVGVVVVAAVAVCLTTGVTGASGAATQVTLPVTGVAAPFAIAVDPSGDLFALDGSDGHVAELSPGPSGTLSDGTQSTLVNGGASAIATDGRGDLYVASPNGLVELVPGGDGKLAGGTQVALPSIATEPEGLAVDQSGDVFASDLANPDVFELAHGSLGPPAAVGFGGLDLPLGVAVDDTTGDIYVAGRTSPGVAVMSPAVGGGFDPASQATLSFAPVAPNIEPFQLAFDGPDLLVSDFGSGQVDRLTPGVDGKLTDGTASTVPFTGLTSSRGIAADASGNLFASDLDSGKVVELIKNVGAVSAAHSTITASPATVAADGVSSVTVTVHARDAHGNPVPAGGNTVEMNAGRGTLSAVTDHGDGTYTATLTSTETGLVSVFASLDGHPIANDATVSFTPPGAIGPVSAAHSTIAATPATVTADGTSSAAITVRARDAADNPEPAGGAAVALTTTRGTLSAVTDHGDGTYTASLTSTQPGAAVVTATLDGAALGGSATVTFSDVAPGAVAPPPATPPPATPARTPISMTTHGSGVPRISKIGVRPHSIGVCGRCAYPRAKVSFTLSRPATVRALVQIRRHGNWTTIRKITIKAHAGTSHHALKGHWAGALTAGAHLRVLVQLRHGRGWAIQKTVTLKTRAGRTRASRVARP